MDQPTPPPISTPNPSSLAQPKPPAPAPVRIKPKLGKNVLGCAGLALLIVLIFSTLVAYAVAKTGVVGVPVLSRWYYGPSPTRLVAAQAMTVDAFRVLLGARFFSQALNHPQPPFAVDVSEKELTGVIMNAIDAALRDASWKQDYTQIVVRPTDLELLSKFSRGSFHLDMLVRFHTVVQDGGVRFDPFFVQIGDYQLPASVAYRAASYLFSRDLGTFILTFGDAKLQDLKLKDGVIEITAASLKPS